MSLGGAFRVFLSELAAVGLDPAALCAAARVEPRALHDRVPLGLDELTRILGRAEAMARDVSLGLHMAERASTAAAPPRNTSACSAARCVSGSTRRGYWSAAGTSRARCARRIRRPPRPWRPGSRSDPPTRAAPMTVRLATAVEGALARGKRTDRETLARSLGMSGKTLARRLAPTRACCATWRTRIDACRRSGCSG